ncbi:MAG: hypothetical protein AMXMBFR66_15350 [Pseudomonadota bacterium]|nr:hypothetical protein [Rubrivivax sp.]
MSTPTLSRVTLQTMANWQVVATQMVVATGAGSRRAAAAVDHALQQQVLARAAGFAPAPVQRIDAWRDGASQRVTQGIRQIEKVATASLERGNRFTTAQIERFADLTAEVKTPFVAEGLAAAARLSLPAAQLALQVSGKAAEAAQALADAAGAHPVRRAVRGAAAKGGRRAAAEVSRVKRGARKAAGAVAKPRAAAKKGARRSAASEQA